MTPVSPFRHLALVPSPRSPLQYSLSDLVEYQFDSEHSTGSQRTKPHDVTLVFTHPAESPLHISQETYRRMLVLSTIEEQEQCAALLDAVAYYLVNRE